MTTVPTLVKIAFLVLALGFLIFIIGFAAPYWMTIEDAGYAFQRYVQTTTNTGLWKVCVSSQSAESCFSLVGRETLSDRMKATQFFETIGMLAMIPCFLFLILGMLIASCRERKILPIVSAICAFGSAGCIILGCIIFGSEEGILDSLDWAFALSLVGGIIIGAGGLLVLVGGVLKR